MLYFVNSAEATPNMLNFGQFLMKIMFATIVTGTLGIPILTSPSLNVFDYIEIDTHKEFFCT